MSGKRRSAGEPDHPRAEHVRAELAADDDGMGEFEDPWEDEIEEESDGEEDAEAEEKGEDSAEPMETDDAGAGEAQPEVYLPGQELQPGEVLEHDSSAYHMLHAVNVEWPCLSFDIIRDQLGSGRTKYPHTAYIAAGTQADVAQNNKLMVLKLSQLCKTRQSDDSDEEDDNNEESDDEAEDDPILEYRHVKHPGGVNRLRVCPQQPHIMATWSDSGRVHVWDMAQHIAALDVPPEGKLPSEPIFTFQGHPEEGFAMDWSETVPGRLLTGDCRKHIYLWNRHEGGSWVVDKVPFNGHTQSVEDLQWSPTEQNVFASCSVDKTVRIWDARKKDRSQLSVTAHSSDVNVISWNNIVNYLLVSGGDDGIFKIWDLRMINNENTPAAQFKWHAGPITSVEWNPLEDSVLAVSGADDQVSLWDLSLERDADEQPDDLDVPQQLLFVHQGQHDIKEVHWHPQIPGALFSTAETGFNIFKTISV